jgi:hypothetical protein
MKELDIMKLHIPISKEAVVQAYATASPGQLEFQKRFLKFATDLNANFIEGDLHDDIETAEKFHSSIYSIKKTLAFSSKRSAANELWKDYQDWRKWRISWRYNPKRIQEYTKKLLRIEEEKNG